MERKLGGGFATLGTLPLTPNVPELIQRNLSNLRYNIRRLDGATTDAERTAYVEEAERLIQMHNKLVRLNIQIMRSR